MQQMITIWSHLNRNSANVAQWGFVYMYTFHKVVDCQEVIVAVGKRFRGLCYCEEVAVVRLK